MATNTRPDTSSPPPVLSDRVWNEFAFRSFAVIIARKHSITVPVDGIDDLSNEELERRLRLVSELAHLPPA